MRQIIPALTLGLLPLAASAHPGDHPMSAMAALLHFVSQASHLPLLLVVIVAGLFVASRLTRKN